MRIIIVLLCSLYSSSAYAASAAATEGDKKRQQQVAPQTYFSCTSRPQMLGRNGCANYWSSYGTREREGWNIPMSPEDRRSDLTRCVLESFNKQYVVDLPQFVFLRKSALTEQEMKRFQSPGAYMIFIPLFWKAETHTPPSAQQVGLMSESLGAPREVSSIVANYAEEIEGKQIALLLEVFSQSRCGTCRQPSNDRPHIRISAGGPTFFKKESDPDRQVEKEAVRDFVKKIMAGEEDAIEGWLDYVSF